MQVYRGMDIGTAKPTSAERARVPHHLIDVAAPVERFSAGEYLRLADEAVAEIRSRGKIPLVVGGTGLYVRALTHGLFEGPVADRAFRDSLIEKEKSNGDGTLYKLLREVDPEATGRIHQTDIRRIVRALEVYHTEGRPLSALHEEHRAAGTDRPVKIAGLRRGRDELYRRIDARVDKMMAEGLLDEVMALKGLGCDRDMTSMQALGYKQLMAFLEGDTTLEEAVRLIKRDTRRYAKRQFTWFNAEQKVEWVDISEGAQMGRTLSDIKKVLDIL